MMRENSPVTLTPIQRFLHRLVEGAPLESKDKTIRVVSNARECLFSGSNPEVEYLTEVDFYSMLISEGRLKLTGPPGNARHLMWAKGRRSGASTFARHWCRVYSNPREGAIVGCNANVVRQFNGESGVSVFSAEQGGNEFRGRGLTAVVFDEASHYPSQSGINSLMELAQPNVDVRMFVSGTPSGNDEFDDLFFQGKEGFWRVRTATWEGTNVLLEEIFQHAHTYSNFMREFGYGW